MSGYESRRSSSPTSLEDSIQCRKCDLVKPRDQFINFRISRSANTANPPRPTKFCLDCRSKVNLYKTSYNQMRRERALLDEPQEEEETLYTRSPCLDAAAEATHLDAHGADPHHDASPPHGADPHHVTHSPHGPNLDHSTRPDHTATGPHQVPAAANPALVQRAHRIGLSWSYIHNYAAFRHITPEAVVSFLEQQHQVCLDFVAISEDRRRIEECLHSMNREIQEVERGFRETSGYSLRDEITPIEAHHSAGEQIFPYANEGNTAALAPYHEHPGHAHGNGFPPQNWVSASSPMPVTASRSIAAADFAAVGIPAPVTAAPRVAIPLASTMPAMNVVPVTDPVTPSPVGTAYEVSRRSGSALPELRPIAIPRTRLRHQIATSSGGNQQATHRLPEVDSLPTEVASPHRANTPLHTRRLAGTLHPGMGSPSQARHLANEEVATSNPHGEVPGPISTPNVAAIAEAPRVGDLGRLLEALGQGDYVPIMPPTEFGIGHSRSDHPGSGSSRPGAGDERL